MSSDNAFGQLNQQAVMLAVQALRHDDAKLLGQLGLTDLDEETSEQLKNLNIDHLHSVGSFRGSLFQLKFEPRQLNICMDMLYGKTREDHQINRAIKAGLRQPMLEELKGVSRREYSARRHMMGLDPNTRGRIESLSEEDEIKVLSVWKKLEHLNDPLVRYLTLHKETGISLDRVWVAIKQFA